MCENSTRQDYGTFYKTTKKTQNQLFKSSTFKHDVMSLQHLILKCDAQQIQLPGSSTTIIFLAQILTKNIQHLANVNTNNDGQ